MPKFQINHRQIFCQLKNIFLGYQTPPSVGLELSSTALKLVELAPTSLVVSRYKIVPWQADNLIGEGVLHDLEAVAAELQQAWHDFAPQAENLAIVIPDSWTMQKELLLPRQRSQYRLHQKITAALAEEISLDEICFDYLTTTDNYTINPEKQKMLDSTTHSAARATPELDHISNEQLINIILSKKERIEEYQAVIHLAGLNNLALIDVESLALTRLLYRVMTPTEVREPFILLDLGASKIRGFLFQEGVCIIHNELKLSYNKLANEQINSRANQQLIIDIQRILQLLNSNLLVEKNSSLQEQTKILLLGGGSLHAELIPQLSSIIALPIAQLSARLESLNPQIPAADLNRIITTIALASWTTCA